MAISKKIVTLGLMISSLTILNASEYTGYSCDNKDTFSPSSYEKGFFNAVNSIHREFSVQHLNGDYVTYEGKYLVGVDIDKLSKEQILIIKNYGFMEGFMPVTVDNGYVYFTDTNRHADAKYIQDMLNEKYFNGKKFKVKIVTNFRGRYKKYDYVYNNIFTEIKKNIDAKVYIVDKNFVPTNHYKSMDRETVVLPNTK
ncbi:MAG: hypothetical protein M0R46_09920 [Candidatus Muirbacterium halophilum]|nr:hypothetical protein [Candidatus Muirbacterium halophilum]